MHDLSAIADGENMKALSVIAAVMAGIILANFGAIFGVVVSIKVAIAKLEVNVDNLKRDVNNLGGMIRKTKNEEV